MPDEPRAPRHGHRPPGVVVLDDDVIVGGDVGRGRWRLLNFRDNLTATNDGDRVDIDASAPGDGGPWPWDYHVDRNYTGASLALQTAFGHEYRTTTTVMAAINDGI